MLSRSKADAGKTWRLFAWAPVCCLISWAGTTGGPEGTLQACGNMPASPPQPILLPQQVLLSVPLGGATTDELQEGLGLQVSLFTSKEDAQNHRSPGG